LLYDDLIQKIHARQRRRAQLAAEIAALDRDIVFLQALALEDIDLLQALALDEDLSGLLHYQM